MLNQSTQTDLQPLDTDDPLACDILQPCHPTALEAHLQGRPYCIRDIAFLELLNPTRSNQPKPVRHKFQEGKQYDNPMLSTNEHERF